MAERKLIHRTVTQQSWQSQLSEREALVDFMDAHDRRKGDLAGDVSYYAPQGRTVVLVRYWPGDNEYGAFYELRNGAIRRIAVVDDGFIDCK
jgi:hypothetical protein